MPVSIVVAAVPIAAAFALFSPQFGAGGSLAGTFVWDRDGCKGANQSPALHWTHPPPGTKGFALSLYDPDAGPAGWWHWIAYDIPEDRRNVAAALSPASPIVKQGLNDFGTVGYGGPCPPPGTVHHYIFTLYALDVANLRASPPLRGPAFAQLLRHHILATATLTGMYGRAASASRKS